MNFATWLGFIWSPINSISSTKGGGGSALELPFSHFTVPSRQNRGVSFVQDLNHNLRLFASLESPYQTVAPSTVDKTGWKSRALSQV